MEITFDAIISVVGMLLGGGCGAFFTWRWQRKKAKAEAEEAEVDMAQKVQETYERILQAKDKEVEDNHRLIGELRMDRDHYKHDRNELREQVAHMQDDIFEMKKEIARHGRMVETMRPFMCYDTKCKKRMRHPTPDPSPCGEGESPTTPSPSSPEEGTPLLQPLPVRRGEK